LTEEQCEYCGISPKPIIEELDWETIVYKDDEGYYWIEMSTSRGFAADAINYCPICGRDLNKR